ncbi:cupin domain-containing protein [Thermodesulfobacteriota bacterium]
MNSIPDGRRGDSLFREAVHLRDRGLSEERARHYIQLGNLYDCKPPKDSEKVDKLVKETAYVFEGRVTVETEEGDQVEIGPGDLVTFPDGMKCTWTVHEKIRKVYKFG